MYKKARTRILPRQAMQFQSTKNFVAQRSQQARATSPAPNTVSLRETEAQLPHSSLCRSLFHAIGNSTT
jgi:hypothetical protein